jgi:2-polyprenyl-3-methyl-5-hydroxy-6-metoxy-1,4-benzoquinol methylase
MTASSCRFCATPLTDTFADLGMSPLSNAFIAPEQAGHMERFYPLHAYVCSSCRLVQLEEFESPEAIFGNYLYFSSFSETWLHHAANYAAMMVTRYRLGPESKVVEIASNDGYLLQYFHHRGIPVLGVEPAANVAKAAVGKGIPTEVAFFGEATAARLAAAGVAPDVIAANNVLAHVPDLNDFVRGIKTLLKLDGVITVEFPHLLRLMTENQFDTIYHEHFSYFSLLVVDRILAHHGLRLFDVTELPTHGGSLRVFACHQESALHARTEAVSELLAREIAAGLDGAKAYRSFGEQVIRTKCDLLDFCIRARRAGKRLVGYGAPAKGSTLLNYCGIGSEFIEFTVDRSPHKQGLMLPGVRIPIYAPEAILRAKPDYVLILPWNLKAEIMQQMAPIRDWGGRFVVPIPQVQVL